MSDINKYSGDKLLSQLEIELFKTATDYEPASELFKKIKADKKDARPCVSKQSNSIKEKQKINMDLSKYNPNSQFLLYKTDKGDVKVDVLLQNETIWLPQSKIAELFDVKIPAISKHLKNIFESGELNEKLVVSILEITTQHGAMES